VAPTQLPAVLRTAGPGDVVRIEPGTYADVDVDLPSGSGGAPGNPILIEGGDAVVFTGTSRLRIASSYVVLKGIRFHDIRPTAVSIWGKGVRLTESEFVNCGDARRTQSECLMIAGGGADAEIDFNSFVGSTSMSVKVRAGGDASSPQPVDVSIHHNVFRDIKRLSDNGQEPVQVAGPGGGGADVRLATRIEHNLFYRAEGDREAISIKLSGISVRWNTFRDMDAAPNLRGAADSIVSDNVLLRVRPIRIAGRRHVLERNVVLCPREHGVAFLVSYGSPGYSVARESVIRENIIAVERVGIVFVAQTQPVEVVASDNLILDNEFYLPKTAQSVRIGPAYLEEVTRTNSISGAAVQPPLCH
jgi:poly(beta-D-mannuronate) lyase